MICKEYLCAMKLAVTHAASHIFAYWQMLRNRRRYVHFQCFLFFFNYFIVNIPVYKIINKCLLCGVCLRTNGVTSGLYVRTVHSIGLARCHSAYGALWLFDRIHIRCIINKCRYIMYNIIYCCGMSGHKKEMKMSHAGKWIRH